MLEIKEFKYILTIAQEGSISQAAEKLFVAQPSLSQFLRNYEALLNTQLFIRTPTGVKPTYTGWRFVEVATEIVESYNAFQRELADINHLESGKINMGIPSKRVVILSDILSRFSRQCPNITINVMEASSGVLEKGLENDSLDVAMLVGPTHNENLQMIHVANEEVFLAAVKQHPIISKIKTDLHNRRWVDIEHLRREEFIILERGHRTFDLSKEFFSDDDIQPRMVRECCSFEVSVGWAGLGTGLVFMPRTFLNLLFQLRYNLDFFSIGECGLYRSFDIATKKNRGKSTLLDTFSIVMKEALCDYFNTLDCQLW